MAKGTQVYLVPGSIIVAGLLIAIGLFYGGSGGGTQVAGGHGDTFGNTNSRIAENIRPVDENDHVLGDRNAKVSIVEFSDFECPFCGRLHPTLARITQEYEGEVNWVYRHFPLSFHRNAESSARASECVARLGGNDAFWNFGDRLFENQRSLNDDLYTQLAGEFGIDQTEFESCLSDDAIAQAVSEDLNDATRSGGRGTPYVVVVRDDGAVFPFSGALPYNQVQGIIEQALNN